jgi:hypothetical protein
MAYNPETLSFDLPSTDQIYVSGLPDGASERDLEEYFGSIGVIKTDKKTRGKKIYMYRDKATGALKGDAVRAHGGRGGWVVGRGHGARPDTGRGRTRGGRSGLAGSKRGQKGQPRAVRTHTPPKRPTRNQRSFLRPPSSMNPQTITYEDPFSAGSAVQWFNGKEWKGES